MATAGALAAESPYKKIQAQPFSLFENCHAGRTRHNRNFQSLEESPRCGLFARLYSFHRYFSPGIYDGVSPDGHCFSDYEEVSMGGAKTKCCDFLPNKKFTQFSFDTNIQKC
jgi:hypothetical protein